MPDAGVRCTLGPECGDELGRRVHAENEALPWRELLAHYTAVANAIDIPIL